MSTYQTEAIVIRSQDFSESDTLLTLFTQKHGKVRGILKSARKSTSKLAGPCQFLNQIGVSVYGKPQLELHKITQVDMVKSREKLRDNLEKLSWASLYIEFLQRVTGDHQHDQELFDLSTLFLEKLPLSRNCLTLTLIYLCRLMQIAGFSPLISQCVKCGKIRLVSAKINHQTLYFDSHKGGILCTSCHKKSMAKSYFFPITSSQLLFVDRVMKEPPQELTGLHLVPTDGKELLDLFFAHARHQLEGDFKTIRFLQSLDFLE